MYNEISPSLYLRAAVPMINAHWLGNCAAEERQGESKTHEIYLWGHFSLLLLSLLVPYYPICPVRECVIYWQGDQMTFESGLREGEMNKDKENR